MTFSQIKENVLFLSTEEKFGIFKLIYRIASQQTQEKCKARVIDSRNNGKRTVLENFSSTLIERASPLTSNLSSSKLNFV